MVSNELVKNTIPSIDFCKPELKPGTSQWESTKIQVFQALQEYGYFEAIYDKVSNEIREAMFDTLQKEIVPEETKLRDYFEKPYHRYEGQIPRMRYETLCADLLLPESIETFANTFWPDGNPNYCDVVKSYTNSLVELDEIVKMMVLESLGLKNYVDEFFDGSVSFLRITHYKAAHSEDGKKSGVVSHTDPGFLTIIKQNQAGLQLLKKNGDWTEVNVSPNSYIVLSADAFMAWTNGRIKSASHKVTVNGDTDRFSMQIFSSPKPGYTMQAPKELVDEEHPLLFKAYDISGYYNYVMSGAQDGIGLKAYCGV